MADSFLIVGNGVFGLSASTHLRRQERQFRNCAKGEPHAPSQDIAKILRTHSPGLVRMKEAQAAYKPGLRTVSISGFVPRSVASLRTTPRTLRR